MDEPDRDRPQCLSPSPARAGVNRTANGVRARLLAGESVIVEVEMTAAPVDLEGVRGPQADVAILVEVVAVGCPAAVLPEHLAVPAAHLLGEVAGVGFFADLDAGGVALP